MGGVPSNLVPQPFARNDGNFITNPLVCVEVKGELGVVPLNDNLGGLLDGLRSNCTATQKFILARRVL